jgi:hypothetical protein
MKKLFFPLLLLFAFLIFACGSKSTTSESTLSQNDKHLCDSLKIDQSVITDLREHTDAALEPFHYSLSRQINSDGTEIELDPIHLPGLVFDAPANHTTELLDKLYDKYKSKGYSIFVVDQNFGIDDKPDVMAILKTTDKFEILKAIKTDGINYDIDNDSLVQLIGSFDHKYSLDLIGASGDWCEFKITKDPSDWMAFANEVYAVCPDVVDQGTGSVDALAEEMKRTKRLYFWWD